MWNNEKQQKSVFHYVKLTNLLSFKLYFQKVEQHTWGKWLIHCTKRRKDNQLQSLELTYCLEHIFLTSECSPSVHFLSVHYSSQHIFIFVSNTEKSLHTFEKYICVVRKRQHMVFEHKSEINMIYFWLIPADIYAISRSNALKCHWLSITLNIYYPNDVIQNGQLDFGRNVALRVLN